MRSAPSIGPVALLPQPFGCHSEARFMVASGYARHAVTTSPRRGPDPRGRISPGTPGLVVLPRPRLPGQPAGLPEGGRRSSDLRNRGKGTFDPERVADGRRRAGTSRSARTLLGLAIRALGAIVPSGMPSACDRFHHRTGGGAPASAHAPASRSTSGHLLATLRVARPPRPPAKGQTPGVAPRRDGPFLPAHRALKGPATLGRRSATEGNGQTAMSSVKASAVRRLFSGFHLG